MSKRLSSKEYKGDRTPTDSSSDSGDDSLCESARSELRTPAKKRYKRSIHHGMNRNRAFHHNTSPERQRAYFKSHKHEVRNTAPSADFAQRGVDIFTDSSSVSSPSTDTDVDSDRVDRQSSKWTYTEPDQIYSDLSDSDLSDASLNSLSDSSFSSTKDVFGDNSDTDTGSGDEDDNKLYEGCNLTKRGAYILIMLYVMKHSISKTGFTDLLHLISAFLPTGASLTTSQYKIKEALKKNSGYVKPKTHCYCEECERLLVDGGACENLTCQRNNAQVMQFHDLRMVDQLKSLFQDGVFLNLVTTQKGIQSPAHERLSDISDGEKYKESIKKRFGPADVNLTFTMNTDGVTLFSSSKKGNLWPVYIAINELPIQLRFSRKYLLPCYLHCQVEKPNMTTYLSPMMQLLDDIYKKGFEVLTAKGKLLVKAQLIAVSVDLPARALVANMKQFNGKTSCMMCLDDGENPPGNPLHRFFPYQENSEQRTHDSVVKDAQKAVRQNAAVRGIKGASPLIFLKYIDLPRVFVIDWMHCVLLGVTKALMCFWFKNQHRNKDHYVGDKMALLNKRLLSIKTPDYVSRRPRKLEEHGHWKASECREWLIHFSVPVLHGVMNPTPLVHYLLLVTAMSILTKDSIGADEINLAEQLLQDFCMVFPSIYGNLSQTMNVHILKHIAAFTRLYGPLFAYSCFGFESMNSYLKGMFHGTRHINNQVVLASVSDLESGFSRDLFIAWCTDAKNSVVLTNRTSPGTLARWLIDNPDNKTVTMEVRRRIKLEGAELEEYLKKKQEKEAEEARLKSEMAKKELEDLESSDESDNEMDVEGGFQGATTKGKHDLMLKGEGKSRTGFFKQVKKSYPMFPYHEERIKWDDYGEIIRPEDYMIAETTPADDEKAMETGAPADESQQDVTEVPTKCVSATVTLDINANVQFIDFEGRSDGESIKKILQQVKPRQLILIHGDQESTDSLAEFCRTQGVVQGKVFTPGMMEIVDATTESHIYQVKLKDSLVSALDFSKARDAELAWVDGQLDFSHARTDTTAMLDEEGNPEQIEDITDGAISGSGDVTSTDLVPSLEALPIHLIPGHTSAFINEPKLSDFKTALLQEGIQAEFVAGVLICNNQVAVRRNEAGRIQLEGCLCDDYYKVRDLLYGQYAIV